MSLKPKLPTDFNKSYLVQVLRAVLDTLEHRPSKVYHVLQTCLTLGKLLLAFGIGSFWPFFYIDHSIVTIFSTVIKK